MEGDSLVEPLFAAAQVLLGSHEGSLGEGDSLPPPGDFETALPPTGCALVAIPLIRFTPFPAFLRPESGEFRVEFVDLPGVAATGATIEKALINAEHAARDYATRAQRSAESVPAPSSLSSTDVPASSHLVIVPLYRFDG